MNAHPTHSVTGRRTRWSRVAMISGAGLLLGSALVGGGAAGAGSGDQPISGRVFIDLNGDGRPSAPDTVDDPAAPGVTVTVFDSTGASATAVTAANGTYSVSVNGLGAGPFRVEFTGYAERGWTSAPVGSATASSVQRSVGAGATVNFGVLDAASYCAANPRLVVSCFTNGNGQAGGTTATARALVSSTFEANGYPGRPGYVAPRTINTQERVGSVYGLGVSRATSRLYAGAFLKRHAGLGPGGLGAVYEVDPATGAVTRTLQVAGVGPVPARDLPADLPLASSDEGVYPLIGRAGLGDVDVAPDGRTLFVTNLTTRSLVRFQNLPAASPVQQAFTLPDAGCPGGIANQRPFGLGTRVRSGALEVYVGVVCTAETSASGSTAPNDDDIEARVLRFADATGTFDPAPVLVLPLRAADGGGRGCVWANPPGYGCAWHAWTDDYSRFESLLDGGSRTYPMPFVSDIEFDATGAMIVGLGDRLGHMLGFANRVPGNPGVLVSGIASGDQLRACATPTGWNLEQNGSCGGTTTTGAGNGQGPGGGEFYVGDAGTGGGASHQDFGLGALASVPGRTSLAATAFDPNIASATSNDSPQLNSSGFVRFDNSTGLTRSAFDINSNPVSGGGTGTFAKASGLGDIEALCDKAPVEVGNVVWFDRDRDGVQDPDEPALPGVTVRLRNAAGTVVATAITDASGRYWFMSEGASNALAGGWDDPSSAGDPAPLDSVGLVSDPNGDPSDGVWGLAAETSYTIAFDVSTVTLSAELNALGVTSAADLALTITDAASGPGSDLRDSDAVDLDAATAGEQVGIVITTGVAGDNNHTFDAGFSARGSAPTTTTTTVPQSTTTAPATTVPQSTTTAPATTTIPAPTTTAPASTVPVEVLPATTIAPGFALANSGGAVYDPGSYGSTYTAAGSSLASTGSSLTFWLAGLGVLLVALGLVTSRRRHD